VKSGLKPNIKPDPMAGPQKVEFEVEKDKPSAGKLQDPLWYAAKYGGFKNDDKNDVLNELPDIPGHPIKPTEADMENNATGDTKPDGIPDNYFLVTNPLGLVSALERALKKVAEGSSGTAVMANSTSLSTTNRIYQARYEPRSWFGILQAKEVDPDDGRIVRDLWEAGAELDKVDQENRIIWTFDDTKGKRTGTPFEYNSISDNLKKLLDISPVSGKADGNGEDRLLYLRGDRSKEAKVGGIFRTRERKLGDIVNSDPAYVGPPSATQTERSYADFRDKYFERTPVLYVGANDGMLHGFDAGSDSKTAGKELLAYVPSKTFPNLTQLTSPTYSHRYYVDGAPVTADVQLGAKKDWRTILVGGLAGGGQGLYALDVTDPTEFTKANASKNVLWEFTDQVDAAAKELYGDPDLGYVYGRPVIRKMSNGEWAAIVSAGYNNKEADKSIGTGKAFLFVIFLNGPGPDKEWIEGTHYFKIEAFRDVKTPDPALANGLAPPFAADVDADGLVDFTYAGDLQGNFWKFDLRGKPETWKSSKVILFQAKDDKGNKQPITSQAEGTLHPSKPGFILVFGTGKYLEMADTVPVFFTQSYYGIWDKNDNADVTKQTVVTDREKQLLDQPIEIIKPGNIRVVPDESPTWDDPHLGWRMDMPDSANTGERIVFRPLLLASRLIFTTLKPSDDPCAGGGTSFLMIVDPTTGGRVNSAVINITDERGTIALNENDKVTDSKGNKVFASGIQSTVGIAPTPVVVKGGPSSGAGGTASSDKIFGTKAPYLAGPETLLGYTFLGGPLGIEGLWIGLRANSGRVSWREIVTN
jgi:type IV pilus assembly protein PilY1